MVRVSQILFLMPTIFNLYQNNLQFDRKRKTADQFISQNKQKYVQFVCIFLWRNAKKMFEDQNLFRKPICGMEVCFCKYLNIVLKNDEKVCVGRPKPAQPVMTHTSILLPLKYCFCIMRI